MAVAILGTAVSCNKSEVQESTPMTQQTAPETVKPPGPALWVAARQSWPDTLRWALDSIGETTVDGLFLRLAVSVQKVFLGGPRAKEQPLIAEVTMTLRPVPHWPLAQGLAMDSVVFYDPIRNARVPQLPMLTARRAFVDATVRTVFTNNGIVEVTVDLDEGQLLEPTVYYSWDKRTLIVTTPPVPVEFLTELKRQKEKLPDWNTAP